MSAIQDLTRPTTNASQVGGTLGPRIRAASLSIDLQAGQSPPPDTSHLKLQWAQRSGGIYLSLELKLLEPKWLRYKVLEVPWGHSALSSMSMSKD